MNQIEIGQRWINPGGKYIIEVLDKKPKSSGFIKCKVINQGPHSSMRVGLEDAWDLNDPIFKGCYLKNQNKPENIGNERS